MCQSQFRNMTADSIRRPCVKRQSRRHIGTAEYGRAGGWEGGWPQLTTLFSSL